MNYSLGRSGLTTTTRAKVALPNYVLVKNPEVAIFGAESAF